MKYVQGETCKEIYGLNQEKRDKVYACFYLMMYAKNAEKYLIFLNKMKVILLGGDLDDDSNKFLNYFMKNWDSCKIKWTCYARKHIPTLGNTTNNRIESGFGKIKKIFEIKYK